MLDYSDILLTADYDRTLTAPDSSIPERNLKAIRDFMAKGGAFTVNTGRSVPMAAAVLERIPVNAPLLLYNGSAAFDMERRQLCQLHEILLDPWETVNTCVQLFPDLAVEVQGVDAHFQITNKPGWIPFNQNNGCRYRMAKPGDDLTPFLKFSLYGAFKTDTVASLFDGTQEELERMDHAEQTLRLRFGAWCEVFRAAPRIIDVHAKGVGKGKAARELQHKLGRKILVCIGDADNDLPMLEDTDYAFIPGDSPLLGRYNAVCPCGDGAVADVIWEKIPNIIKRT